MTKTNKTNVLKLTILAVLTALELVMAFTPVGYLKIGILSISFMCIPVALGAIILGPSAGAILGAVFGLTSFAQCFGADLFGTSMFTANPFATFVITVVARVLMGWLTGVIAWSLGKVFNDKTVGKYYLNDIVAIILCPALNTLFFLGFLAIFFHAGVTVSGVNVDVIKAVIIPALSINCVVEILTCAVVGSAISIPVKKAAKL